MQIGYISSEGGPFLIGDYSVLTHWNGIENDDYRLLIETPDEDFPYQIKGSAIVAWDPLGGAVVSVHTSDSSDIVLIKSFEEIKENEKYLHAPGQKDTYVGAVEVLSGVLLLLYATESGALLSPIQEKAITRPSGDLAFEDSCLAIPVKNGTYHCISDYVFGSEKLYQAKRLTLRFATA